MIISKFLPLAILVIALQATAQEPLYGPEIEGYGPVFAIEDRDVPLHNDRSYKAVFDASVYPGNNDALNVELESVARFINMHSVNGIAIERMEIAVVVHGAALRSVLSDDAYRSRFDADNPNSELLRKLQAAGVSFYVCGQSMGFRGFRKEELADRVKLSLSAMTMLVDLQADGYSLIP